MKRHSAFHKPRTSKQVEKARALVRETKKPVAPSQRDLERWMYTLNGMLDPDESELGQDMWEQLEDVRDEIQSYLKG